MIAKPDGADLRVTVSRQSSRGYVWYCALFALASAAFFVAAVVRWVSEGVELEWWELAWALAGATLVVGLGVFGAVVHARPLVEEATVREGSLSLVRSRYLRRQTFFGSRADGLRVQVRDPFGFDKGDNTSGELLFSVPGRAASFGNVLPRATLEFLRVQIETALGGAAEPTAAGRP